MPVVEQSELHMSLCWSQPLSGMALQTGAVQKHAENTQCMSQALLADMEGSVLGLETLGGLCKLVKESGAPAEEAALLASSKTDVVGGP